MKVYLLWAGQYSDVYVVGVYDTLAGAMASHQEDGHRWKDREYEPIFDRMWDCQAPDWVWQGQVMRGECDYRIEERELATATAEG